MNQCFRTLGTLVLSLVAASTAAAQQYVTLEYQSGGPNVNGYATARIDAAYNTPVCDDNLRIVVGIEPSSLRVSSTYWYNGASYEVNPTELVTNSASVSGQIYYGNGSVASFNLTAMPTMDRNCAGIASYQTLGPIAGWVGQGATSEQERAFAGSLYARMNRLPTPRTSPAAEDQIRNMLAEERRLADAERQRVAQAEAERQRLAEVEAERQRQQAVASQSSQGGAVQQSTQSDAAAEAERQAELERQRQAQAQAEYEAEMARLEAERRAAEAEAEAIGEFVNTIGQVAMASDGFLTIGYLMGETYAGVGYSEFSGLSLGIDWKHFFIDFGMLSGVYDERMVEQYALDNFGAELTPEFEGFYMTPGYTLEMGDETLGLGVYGGWMMVMIPEIDAVSNPVLGMAMRFGGFKMRTDIGLGAEFTTFQLAAGFDLF